jgi:hypothetical protein
MHKMKLLLRESVIVLGCLGCGQEFTIDPDAPFIPQLRAFSYDHHCRLPRPRTVQLPPDPVPQATLRQVQPARGALGGD